MIILSELNQIRTTLNIFKNDLPSLRDNRVEINLFSEKLYNFGCVCVCEEDNITKGFAAFYANDVVQKIAFLSMIAVKKSYRRENIGSKILEFVEKEALQRGMLILKLEVSKENCGAINFYTKHGYSICDETNDTYYMKKEIG